MCWTKGKEDAKAGLRAPRTRAIRERTRVPDGWGGSKGSLLKDSLLVRLTERRLGERQRGTHTHTDR